MSKSVKGLSAVVVRDPPQIKVSWDRMASPNLVTLDFTWWCIGDPIIETSETIRQSSRFLIDARPGKTYVIAAQAYFWGNDLTPWAYVVVEVPQEEHEHTDLGQVTVIDTPRSPAILLDGLREACGQ